MEGTGMGAAMLVGTPGDVGNVPTQPTVTLNREEIEEALASDAPLELILSVQVAGGELRDVPSWKRSDLESVLAGVDAGPITFSFDRASSTGRSSIRTSRAMGSASSSCSSRQLVERRPGGVDRVGPAARHRRRRRRVRGRCRSRSRRGDDGP